MGVTRRLSMIRTKLMLIAALGLGCTTLPACGESTPPPQTVASNTAKTTAHGSGGGTGSHGHRKEASGNKDGEPGGTSTQHGSGKGGGRNGGKPGEALGNKD